MKIVFSLPLGLDVGLGVSPLKQSPIGAVIGAGISAIGSLVGNQMQNNANSNLNRENQLFQAGMLHEQQNWSEKMWNKENEYNTPLAQRQRLQEAGYNPWISGSGGPVSNVAQTPSSQGSTPAPASMPMRYDNPFGNLGQTINDMVRTNAESANQLSQAAQNGVNTAVALYEKTGDFEAAQQYLSTVLRSIGGANMNEDSMYFRQLGLSIIGIDLDNASKRLQNARQDLENGLIAKYGDAKASAQIANLEQLTTKYVGELGLMSSQADLNRSEIKLNEDKAYELGARAAREFAEAGLFTSETKLNDGIRDYLIGNSQIGYLQNKMEYFENKATFDSRKSIRDWKVTPDSQSRQLWNYQMSPEGNYVTSFMEGFTRSANVSFGVNTNFNRSRSNSFTRGISDTRVFDMNHWGRNY